MRRASPRSHCWQRSALILIIALAVFSPFQPSPGGQAVAAPLFLDQLRATTTARSIGGDAIAGVRAVLPSAAPCDARAGLPGVRQRVVHWHEDELDSQPGVARLVFDPNVTLQDQELITEAVRLAEDFFTIRLAASLGSGVTVTALPIACPRSEERIASTVGQSMVIYAQSLGWLKSPPAERVRTIIHEYTHAYQFSKSAEAPYPSAAWFEEGIAEYLSLIALSDLGLMNRAEMEGLFGEIVHHSDLPPLQELENHSAWQSQQGAVYPLAYFAVAQLLQNLPLSSIDAYYTHLQDGLPFAAAFTLTFGITPSRFYEAFAQFRANQLPEMGFLPAELQVSEGIDQPATVTVSNAPSFVIPGQQTLVVSETQPASNCTLDLIAVDDTVVINDRETFANGAGQAFWLLTIPVDAPAGTGEFLVDCGADPLTIPVLLT